MDNRAMSVGLARFILSLVMGAPILWITFQITDPILSRASNSTSNPDANQATDWFGAGIGWLPIAFLLIAFFGVIVLAIFQRELLR